MPRWFLCPIFYGSTVGIVGLVIKTQSLTVGIPSLRMMTLGDTFGCSFVSTFYWKSHSSLCRLLCNFIFELLKSVTHVYFCACARTHSLKMNESQKKISEICRVITPTAHGLQDIFSAVFERFLQPIHVLRVKFLWIFLLNPKFSSHT